MKSSTATIAIISMILGTGNVFALGPVAASLYGNTAADEVAVAVPARAAVYYPEEGEARVQKASLMGAYNSVMAAKRCKVGTGYNVQCLNAAIPGILANLDTEEKQKAGKYISGIKACPKTAGMYEASCVESRARAAVQSFL